MKLNKSLFYILGIALFLASSCSQSRYGNLTRRTKASHIAKEKVEHKPVKKEKVERLSSVKIELSEFNVSPLDKNDVKPIEVDDALVSLETQVDTRSTKLAEKEVKVKDLVRMIPTPIKTAKKVKKILKEEKKDEASGLVRLLLIVLLVLLILSLITKVLPILNWIIGILLLVVLIWFIMQLL